MDTAAVEADLTTRAAAYIRSVARERTHEMMEPGSSVVSEKRAALRIGQHREIDPTFVRCETFIRAVGACPERIFAAACGLGWWRGSQL